MKGRVKIAAVSGVLLLLLLLGAGAAFAVEWNEQVLYSFQGEPNDGFWPAGGVVFDKAGNLYGATQGAGPDSCYPDSELCGLVYELSPPAKKGDPWTETILMQFRGKESNDVSLPSSGMIIDGSGNLYGVSGYGGTGDCVILGTPAGCGTVYEMSPPKRKGDPWTEAILYSFKGGNDGYSPSGNLTFDKAGNLYGATNFGGGKGNSCNEFYGGNCGTVFKLSPPNKKGGNWTEQVLHSFAGGTDGAVPNGSLVIGKKGAIYGTTPFGANQICNYGQGQVGCGTFFELLPPNQKGRPWTEKILHRFTNGNDGDGPSSLVLDTTGRLYGTAGGKLHVWGFVFRFALKSNRWIESDLYDFPGGDDGEGPGGLIFDSVGNLYGVAAGGVGFYGVVFRLDRPKHGDSWTESVLYSFTQKIDGDGPEYSLIFDRRGDLYGTTDRGGTGSCSPNACGVVYEVSP